ncbi:MAG: hypothetical protein WBJ13_13695 [Sedimentibacter sp.]
MGKAVILDYPYLGGLEIFKEEKEKLKEYDIDLIFADCKTEDEIIKTAIEADIILCCGNPPITRKVISSLNKCKVVIRYGIGVNSVDLEAATEYKKIVYFMPGFCAGFVRKPLVQTKEQDKLELIEILKKAEVYK